MRVKEESEKAGLKLNIQKTIIMASVPSHHGKYRRSVTAVPNDLIPVGLNGA